MLPRMSRRAVLFDLDGTLADTLATISAAVNHGLARLELPQRPIEQVRDMVGEGVMVLCQKALPGARQDALDDLMAEVRAFYDDHALLHARLYDGIEEMIERLQERGAELAVLSNKPHPLTVRTLEGLGVADSFHTILGATEELPRKPDPAAVHWILERMDLAPGDVLYVGDTAIDIRTAQAAGMRMAAATWGFRSRAELLPFDPTHLVDQPAQIVPLFDLLGESQGSDS